MLYLLNRFPFSSLSLFLLSRYVRGGDGGDDCGMDIAVVRHTVSSDHRACLALGGGNGTHTINIGDVCRRVEMTVWREYHTHTISLLLCFLACFPLDSVIMVPASFCCWFDLFLRSHDCRLFISLEQHSMRTHLFALRHLHKGSRAPLYLPAVVRTHLVSNFPRLLGCVFCCCCLTVSVCCLL